MASKPTTTPRWARTAGGVDASNVAAPTSSEQDAGWTNGQGFVSSSKMNWLFNWLYKWSLYVKDAVFVADAGGGLPGVDATGDGAAQGVKGTGGATNGKGVTGQGVGSGAGVAGTGGATGAGVTGVGGATSGVGVTGTGTAGNSRGGDFAGQGSGTGVAGTGGATGAGVSGSGGATSGDGVVGTGTGGGNGGTFTGQGAGKGVSATGGATGAGGEFTPGGGGAPTRGAVKLAPQGTPSAPVDGDVWIDTTLTPNRLATRIGGVTSNALVSPSLNANYSNAAGFGYLRSPDGVVRLEGAITVAAGAGATIFTLPAGYRPAGSTRYFVVINQSQNTLIAIIVTTAGLVQLGAAITGQTAPTAPYTIEMAPISFLAEA